MLFKIIRGLKYLFREKYEEESKKGPGLEQLVSNEELEKVVNFLKRLKDTVEDNLSTGGEKVSPFNINFLKKCFDFHHLNFISRNNSMDWHGTIFGY